MVYLKMNTAEQIDDIRLLSTVTDTTERYKPNENSNNYFDLVIFSLPTSHFPVAFFHFSDTYFGTYIKGFEKLCIIIHYISGKDKYS